MGIFLNYDCEAFGVFLVDFAVIFRSFWEKQGVSFLTALLRLMFEHILQLCFDVQLLIKELRQFIILLPIMHYY